LGRLSAGKPYGGRDPGSFTPAEWAALPRAQVETILDEVRHDDGLWNRVRDIIRPEDHFAVEDQILAELEEAELSEAERDEADAAAVTAAERDRTDRSEEDARIAVSGEALDGARGSLGRR
jgi:hypothetical protein